MPDGGEKYSRAWNCCSLFIVSWLWFLVMPDRARFCARPLTGIGRFPAGRTKSIDFAQRVIVGFGCCSLVDNNRDFRFWCVKLG